MTIERRQCLHPLTRSDIGVSILVGICALALYVRTLAPSLLWSDSAELQTLASTLGMAHSTGYPIYLLIGKLFTLLPVGSVAYRVNLLSAWAAALTLALLYLLGRSLGCRHIAALVGPLALGLCTLFWWHAVIAETYTMSALFITAVLLLVVRWRHTANWRYLFAAGVVGGLSLGVHTTVALTAPTVLLYLLLTARRRADWAGAVAGAAVGVVLTGAAFLFLDMYDAPASFYNSTARPWLSRWGLYPYGFATPFQRIAFIVSARQFNWAIHRVPLPELGQRLQQYAQFFLTGGWTLLTIALAVLGLVVSLLRRSGGVWATWREALMLLLIWLTLLVFVLNYNVFDVYVFYIPTYVPLAVLASLGASTLLDGAAWLLRRTGAGRAVSYGTALIGVLLLLNVIWPMGAAVRDSVAAGHITFLDNTDFAEFPYPVHAPNRPYDRGLQLANEVEDNAIVFTNWGTVFTLYYVAHVEQGRTGIAVHEWFSQNDDPAANISVIRYIDANLGKRPIYFTYIPDSLRPIYSFEQVQNDNELFRITQRSAIQLNAVPTAP